MSNPRPAAARTAVPAWAIRTLTTSGAVLLLAGTVWLVLAILLCVPLVTVTVAVARLLTALVQPVAAWPCRRRLHPASRRS